MMFAERQQAHGTPVPEIIATDVSEAAIARARSGCYTQFEVQRGLPIRQMVRWFDGRPNNEWVVRSELLCHISVRQLNLTVDPAPRGSLDLMLSCGSADLRLCP